MENGEEAPKQEQKMDTTNDEVKEKKEEEVNKDENQKQINEMKTKIETWIRENDYVELSVISIESFLVNFAIGPQKLPFQLGVDASWKPIVCYFFLFPFISQ